jgi:hypothetical protein
MLFESLSSHSEMTRRLISWYESSLIAFLLMAEDVFGVVIARTSIYLT